MEAFGRPVADDGIADDRHQHRGVAQQRLHWLAEQALSWSGLPVVHIRPTVFLDTPRFTTAARSIKENRTIALPFGTVAPRRSP